MNINSEIVIKQHYFYDLVKSPYFDILSPQIIGEKLYDFRKTLGVTKQQLLLGRGILRIGDISLIESGKEPRPIMWKKYISLLLNYSNQLKF